MGKVADLSVFTPGGQPGAPNPSEGLAVLRQNQTAFMEIIGVMPPEALTIVDGAISPTTAVCIVDTEGGAPADDLTTINATLSDGGTLHDGMVILLSAKDASRVVTVKNSDAPNGVKTVDGKDIALSPKWCLVLQYVGGVWQQINVSAPLKPATKTTLGGVMVGDGLTALDGTLSADLATEEEAGRVKASITAKSGAVPLGGADGVINKSWIPSILFNSRVVITESNASWTPPVKGWSRVTVIGGGGAGTSWLAGSGVQLAWGDPGGDTTFGTITAQGGATSRALPNSATISGRYRVGGGCAGEVKTEYIYLDKSSPVKITIGAGGIAGAGTSTSGYTGNPGTDTTNDSVGSSAQQAWGGNGGRTGYGYGGGGGACGLTWGAESTPCNPHSPGYGHDGGKNAVDAASNPLMGGNGGQGAVIIEYYDPEKEDA